MSTNLLKKTCNNKIDAIFFVSSLNVGGIENYLLRFLQFKHDVFSSITVFCKSGKDGQLKEEYLKIPNLIIHKFKIPYCNPIQYFRLKKYLKTAKYDAICDFTGNFAGIVLYISKLSGIKKRVVWYRGASDHFSPTLLRYVYNSFVKHLTYKYATNILSNSQSAFDFFYKNKIADHRFEVIYNGIDISKFEVTVSNLRKEFKIPEKAFVIGHTGRFDKSKNHETIISVAEELVSRYEDIYFILCGNGVKRNLQPIVEEKKIDNRVLLFENRTDIPAFLNTMNLYFFPSTTEGQPNALIEAMAMQLPFTASNIDSIKETVGVNNLDKLFDPHDVDSFVIHMEKMYRDRPARIREYRNYVIEKFNHEKLFNDFFYTLTNTRS